MLVGAHVPVSGGYGAAVEYAASAGCECAQVFLRNPRQWRSGPPPAEAVASFREARERLSFGPVFSHTAYLINLASPDAVLRGMSVTALAEELSRGALFGVDGVVTHIGSARGLSPPEASDLTAASIAEARREAGPGAAGVPLLLENSAGGGASFGCSPEELCSVLERLSSDHGLCHLAIDTCHAHAYGIDVSSVEAWDSLLGRIEGLCGPGLIRLLHANDCAFPLGAKRDRHAWIGDGAIGERGFEAMLSDPRLSAAPAVTEMPGERPFKDEENMRRLKRLRGD